MNLNLRKLSNNFLDVRLVSLAAWKRAAEISPRDRNGPYVVLQEGYDPQDTQMAADEFVLGRSGQWLSLGLFFKMPVADRRQEYVFGTAGEVMQLLGELPAKVSVIRPGAETEPSPAAGEDEMAAAFKAGKSQGADSEGKS